MKTDLTRILSVSGQHGLFSYIAQARNGAIVESLATKERSCYSINSKMTTLADISIYTTEGELKLQEVFLKLKEVLADAEAPSPKSKPEEIKALFKKAIPDYDEDRFYVSHMKKVLEWYNQIKQYASFEFASTEEVEKEEIAAEDAEDAAEDKVDPANS